MFRHVLASLASFTVRVIRNWFLGKPLFWNIVPKPLQVLHSHGPWTVSDDQGASMGLLDAEPDSGQKTLAVSSSMKMNNNGGWSMGVGLGSKYDPG